MAQADYTRIATNIGALNALQSLRTINNKLGIHQQRLSTGKRINSAADDPAGLTIATKFLSRSEGMKVSLDNIGDAKNLLSVAESGVSRINDILVQMRNKVLSAASDTLGTEERAAIQTQLENYAAQIDDVSNFECYGVAHPEIVRNFDRVRPPFNVNRMAHHAALAALDDEAHLRRSVEVNEKGRKVFEDMLPKLVAVTAQAWKAYLKKLDADSAALAEEYEDEIWSVVQLEDGYATDVDTFSSEKEAIARAKDIGGANVVKGTQIWNKSLGVVEESDRRARGKFYF